MNKEHNPSNYKHEWVIVAQSCLTLCNPMDGSPPGSSVHGILQARLLEWVAVSFSSISMRGKCNRLLSIEEERLCWTNIIKGKFLGGLTDNKMERLGAVNKADRIRSIENARKSMEES